jgi:hypothetical protein
METEIVPGLDALGLSGTAVWEARDRFAPRSFPGAAPFVLHDVVRDNGTTDAASLGATWLERAVGSDGSVRFSVDPLTEAECSVGLMHHGRAAVALAALRARDRKTVADRLADRLARDVRSALGGAPVEGWPDQPALIAGTVALACLAGCDLRDELSHLARTIDFQGNAWHAAQVVTALGADAPEHLYRICVHDLDVSPWAPWTARAAAVMGDVAVRTRAVRGLVFSLAGLDASGCSVQLPAPAIAQVAATVEGLAGEDSEEAQQARLAARAYLVRWQFSERPPPGIDPDRYRGGFPLSPDEWLLRTDVTAHAVLALGLG